MFRLGAKTESDVLKAEVQQGDFRALFISEQENLIATKRSLNTIMGRSPIHDFEIEIVSMDKSNIPDLETANKLLLVQNREYQALKKTYQSQGISISIAREALYLPFPAIITTQRVIIGRTMRL